jgi:hypothetical protein
VALDAQKAISDACAAVMVRLQNEKLVRPDADLGYETERLHALVDGLALHALTADRKDLRPKAILAVLGKHLAELEPN